MHFGALRVLNDDTVAPGMGFGKHPHDNMEIISIPLEGDLEHQDSMGTSSVIRKGDIQSMSAGTGIVHSEKNKNNDQMVRFLQIWVIPNQRGVTPRYDQVSIEEKEKENKLATVVSPVGSKEGGVHIHQNAWFHIGKLDQGAQLDYSLHDPTNGVYAFILEGEAVINDIVLSRRDGLGIQDADQIKIMAQSEAEILLMEVPMN